MNMDDQPQLPLIPPRRVRKLPKVIFEKPEELLPGPAVPNRPPVDTPVAAPTLLSANDVIQITSGQDRGVLAQVADFDGRNYRLYRINPPDMPTVFTAAAGDLKYIGPGKVASRNPLISLEKKPDPLPEVDVIDPERE